MRNRICLAAAVLCALAGAPAAAQVRTGSVLDRRVTVTFNQAPLESVLRTLKRQYGIRISYSNTALNLRQPVTLTAQNQPLRTVLSEVLDGKNIGYELVGDQLVLHPAPPKAPAPKPAPAASAATTTTVSRSPEPAPEAPAAAAKEPAVRAGTSVEPVKTAPSAAPSAKPKSAAPAKKAPGKPASGTAAKSSATSRVSTSAASGKGKSTSGGAKSTAGKSPAAVPAAVERTRETGNVVAANAPTTGATADPGAATPTAPPATTTAPAAGPTPAVADSAAAPAAEVPAEPARPTFTRSAQISLLGPLGSNGLRAGQTVNHVSINLLGGYAAGVDGFEAGGLVNVDRDTVAGVQLAGLANVVGRHLNGFQAAGLANVLGGPGRGVQAAGLLNLATRPVAGAQLAGLFNYAGPRKRPAEIELTASTADVASTTTAVPAGDAPGSTDKAAQVAGLFNVALTEVRGGQVAGLLNVAHTVRGVQVAGLVNIADSVQGVSLAPFNFVRHGYHRLEATYSETWPVTLSLKLGGSAAFYTFITAAYDGFGSGPRRWATGYGFGSDMWARRRVSLSLDAVAMQVNEEQRGVTNALNLHNQLRLLVGLTPFKPGSHFRLVGGPTFSVLVTQRYDTAEGRVYSNLSQGRKYLFDEGNTRTRVQGWYGYSVGLRF